MGRVRPQTLRAWQEHESVLEAVEEHWPDGQPFTAEDVLLVAHAQYGRTLVALREAVAAGWLLRLPNGWGRTGRWCTAPAKGVHSDRTERPVHDTGGTRMTQTKLDALRAAHVAAEQEGVGTGSLSLAANVAAGTEHDAVEALLAAGYQLPADAVLRVVYSDEAYYRGSLPDPNRRDWSLGIDSDDGGGGTYGEVSLLWSSLYPGRETWQLKAFGDGLPQVAAAGLIELLSAHGDAQPDELKALLAAAGWQDKTERQRPARLGAETPVERLHRFITDTAPEGERDVLLATLRDVAAP